LKHSSPFYMRVQGIGQLTSPECADVIVKLDLAPMPGEALRPFVCGQIVRLGLPGLKSPPPGYFAIASEPENRACYEFVIKRTQGIARMLADLQPGAKVQVDGPMGRGFDLAPFQGCDVYLIGVGTGIAPLRSVWRSLIRRRREYGKIAIYAGFLTPMHRLLTDELEALAKEDVEVHVSVTTGGESWEGPIGFVQDALEADAPGGENAVACLSGMSAMVDACRQTLHNLGFDDRRILLNF